MQACYACRSHWVDRYADVLQLYIFHDRVPKVVRSRWYIALLHILAALHSNCVKIVEVLDPNSVCFVPSNLRGQRGEYVMEHAGPMAQQCLHSPRF